jgi:predicted neuraminidase
VTRPSRTSLRWAFLLCLAGLGFGVGFVRAARWPPPAPFRVAKTPAPSGAAPRLTSRFVSKRHGVNAHAACLVELGDGRLRAFWFSGSQEGAEDVKILSAVFDPGRGIWGEAQAVAGPDATRRALLRHVVKVGNPTAVRADDGTLWLFYVTVTVGGWGGSTVSVVRSRDEGVTWGPARRLVGSPLLNLNTMVRGAPVIYQDGTLGLPAYQSLVSGFSELLRLDHDGAVIDRQRLSTPGHGSQPSIVPTSPLLALVLMRASGRPAPGRVMLSRTRDGGRSFSRPEATALPNPDAGISGIALSRGRLLLALNDVDVERDALSLVVSDDRGASFRLVDRLEDQVAARSLPIDDARYARTVERLACATDDSVGEAEAPRFVASSRRFMCWEPRCHFEFSYPFLLRTAGGDFHLLYTWNRAYIKHVQFNQAWLEERLARVSDAPRH